MILLIEEKMKGSRTRTMTTCEFDCTACWYLGRNLMAKAKISIILVFVFWLIIAAATDWRYLGRKLMAKAKGARV